MVLPRQSLIQDPNAVPPDPSQSYGFPERLEIRDGNDIVRAAVTCESDGGVRIETFDAAGVSASTILTGAAGSFSANNADGSVGFAYFPSGEVTMTSGNALVRISATGAVQAVNGSQSGSLDIDAAGNITLSGTVFGLSMTATDGIVFQGLPTADPVVAGALWSNAGVVTVSAG